MAVMKKRRTSMPVEGLPRTFDKPHYVFYTCPKCGGEIKLHSSYIADNVKCECSCGYGFLAGDELGA